MEVYMKNNPAGYISSIAYLRYSPILALICAVLFWSGNFIIGRALRDHVDPVSLNFWRWLIALMFILPCGYQQVWSNRLQLLSVWKRIAWLGLTGIAAFHICVYKALLDTTAINALIILSIAPVVIVISSCFFFRETMTVRQGIGILISLIGAIVLITHGNIEILLHFNINRGDIWMLLAVPIWSLYCLLLKHNPPNLPHLTQLSGSIIAGLIFMSPLYAFGIVEGNTLPLTSTSIIGILYISIFASVLAFFFWNYGVSQIGPNKAGMFLHLMPFFGSVLSIIFLEDGFAAYHYFGAAFVFAGIFATTGEQLAKAKKTCG